METGGQMSLTGHPQSAAFLQPRKTPLQNPLFRNNREARHVTAFDHFDAGPEHLLDGPGKGLPSIASIHQHVLDVRQGGRVKPKGGQRPAWSDTFAGGTCSAWGKPCVSKARCRLIPELSCPCHTLIWLAVSVFFTLSGSTTQKLVFALPPDRLRTSPPNFFKLASKILSSVGPRFSLQISKYSWQVRHFGKSAGSIRHLHPLHST